MRLRGEVVAFLMLATALPAYDGHTGNPEHAELVGGPWYSAAAVPAGRRAPSYLFNDDGCGFHRSDAGLHERFQWSVSGGILRLKFPAIGEKAFSGYKLSLVEGKKGWRKLTILTDPRQRKAAADYFRKETRDDAGRPHVRKWKPVWGF